MSPMGTHGFARPLTLQLYERVSLPPAALGVCFTLAYLALLAALCLATGRYFETDLTQSRFWDVPAWWTELVQAVLCGLGPTILFVTLRAAQRDVRELAPVLGGPRAVDAAQRRATHFDAVTLRRIGAATVLGGIAFSYFDPGLWSSRPRPALTDPFFLWTVARHVVLGWIWARAMYVDVTTARAFGALADSIQEVDLLDLRPLTPFARRGVRSVLFWMLATTLFSLFWAAPNAGSSNVVSFALFVVVAAAGLAFPLLGIRRRIRAAKDEALRSLRNEIRADQRALLDGRSGSGPAAARLPALLAAEARVMAARELPVDASTVVRFALYALVGVGSWLGGALVERGLGTVLD